MLPYRTFRKGEDFQKGGIPISGQKCPKFHSNLSKNIFFNFSIFIFIFDIFLKISIFAAVTSFSSVFLPRDGVAERRLNYHRTPPQPKKVSIHRKMEKSYVNLQGNLKIFVEKKRHFFPSGTTRMCKT